MIEMGIMEPLRSDPCNEVGLEVKCCWNGYRVEHGGENGTGKDPGYLSLG